MTPGVKGAPPTEASYNCVIPTGYAFAAVSLYVSYTATVTVKDDTSAGFLVLRGGAIDQATATDGVNDFTVSFSMEFTGGTRGILHLTNPVMSPAFVSTIGGAANTTVTTGSTVEINGYAALLYTNGTIAFKNGSYFHSMGGSTVDATDLTGNSVFTHAGGDPNPHIVEGVFTLKSNSQRAFKVQSGGHLLVVKSLEIAGNWDPAVSGSASLWMRDTASKITVTNNTELNATNGYGMNAGTFETTDVGLTTSNHTVILRGDMSVTGGIIDLSQDSNGLHLGALEVVGNVTFTGGTFNARVVGTATSEECNRWLCTGEFNSTAAATLAVSVSSGTPDPNVCWDWTSIEAQGTFPVGTVLPTVTGTGFSGVLSTDRKQFNVNW